MTASLTRIGACLTLASGFIATSLSAQTPSYSIIDIGDFAPAGQSDGTNATGMNELGHVAAVSGDGSGGAIPALYRDGQLINLGGFPGGIVGGGSKGVNNLDHVAGWSMQQVASGGYQSEPFVWTEEGGMDRIFADESVNLWGEIWDVNDAGQAAYRTGCGFYDPATGYHELDFPWVGPNSGWAAWDLNEDGVVAGSARGLTNQIEPFRYDSATDTIVSLIDPLLDFKGEAYGINDLGDVAGWVYMPGPIAPAMVWTADGQTHRIYAGDLGVNQIDGTAEHVNNHGDVVGIDRSPAPSAGNPDFEPIGWVSFDALEGAPFVKHDLLDLVDPAQAADWRRLHPFEINDRGEICGIAVAAAGGPSGGARGFLMVPNTPDRFRNLSRALAGVDGHPVMVGKGTLEAGTALDVALYKGAPNAVGFLMLGLETAYAPLRGGVLVPDVLGASGVAAPIITDGNGQHSVSTTWQAGIPADLDVVAQYWLLDAAGKQGASASNAVVQQTK